MEDLSEQAQLRRGFSPSYKARRTSYSPMLDSDLESSTDESKTIRSRDAASPSEPYKDTEKSPEYFRESDYEAAGSHEDWAGVETFIEEPVNEEEEAGVDEYEDSIGKHVDKEAVFEFNSSDYDYRKETQTDHRETARKPVASQYEGFDWRSAIKNRPSPWIAECNYGTAFLKYPVYAANHQHLNSHSVQATDPGRMNKDQLAQPLIRASWEGDFAISANPPAEEEARFGGLKGCLSVKACAEARQVVERMPPTIRWEKVPKYCVWRFEQWGPKDNNIAVFFFPSLTRHESAYDSLVMELVRDDLALKTRVMGSELLLFTSVELPPLFTRFQGKLYLWGVFRGKRPQLSIPV